MGTPARIMCVLDSAKSSDDALRYAIAKAKQQHAELTVVRVIACDENMSLESTASSAQNTRSTWSPAHEIDIEINCEELRLEGDPADEIVDRARQLAVDHIVIGASGEPKCRRIEMGRTARRVLSGAPCAVTVVNNEDVPQ